MSGSGSGSVRTFLYGPSQLNETALSFTSDDGLLKDNKLELGSRSRGIGSGYGLIEADRTNEDLRVVSQRLTAEGRKLMARVVKVMEA